MQDVITSGNFTFHKTSIEGLILVDVKTYGDTRGFFMEVYKQDDFIKGGIDCNFVQDNQSSSVKYVLRGLHFQKKYPQAKLVRVIHGKVFDVAVDLRAGSPTYGQWEGAILSEENHRQLFIPKGFAHGFLVMSDSAEFSYKCDDFYHPDDEGGIKWDDPSIGVKWPTPDGDEVFDVSKLNLSQKDINAQSFAQVIPFKL